MSGGVRTKSLQTAVSEYVSNSPSLVEIRSVTSEIRRRKKKEERKKNHSGCGSSFFAQR